MSLFSIAFLVFLAALAVVFFLIPKKWQWICLLVFSYAFYLLVGSPRTIVFLIVSTVSVFLGGVWIDNVQQRFEQTKSEPSETPLKERKKRTQKKKTCILILIVILNLAILGTIKYGAFVVNTLNSVIVSAGGSHAFSVPGFLLPLGISFYTFQSIGYLIDVSRGRIRADRNLLKFALFVSYFPQIIQGPISRYEQLAGQLYAEHAFDYRRVKFGIQRMIWGYFKKMVIADRLVIVVREVFENYHANGFEGFTLFLGVLVYGVQIYADFSGGIDIVLGISEIFGIEQPENFRQPFMARSVTEFWQRWHITLGTWMREYVFYPLALSKPFARWGKSLRKRFGNKSGKIIPTCTASFIVFLLVGIWHGAAWKYIAYGLFHAVIVSAENLFEGGFTRMKTALHVKEKSVSWIFFQIVRTNLIITIGRYLSRAVSLRSALSMWGLTLRRFNPWIFFDGTVFKMGLSEKNVHLSVILVVVLLVVDILHERGVHIREEIEKRDVVFRWTIYFAAIFAIVILGIYGRGYNAANFIYQGF